MMEPVIRFINVGLYGAAIAVVIFQFITSIMSLWVLP